MSEVHRAGVLAARVRGKVLNLQALAKAWAGQGAKPKSRPLQVDEEVIELMRRAGASAEDLELARQVQAVQEEADPPAEVWEDNWDSWLFFMRVAAQWVRTGWTGVRVALDWPGIEVVAKALGYRGKRWRGLVEDLLVIQAEALATFAAQQEQEAGD
ncbi:MAG: DUF1799 domain-containing protein [Hydrogenophaga sp.]|nr:DUF1799 domain-containing protein [Hydrogenophaga sp.]